jgi:hypothetical protein
MWKSYLDEVRDEVRFGLGIFSEDEHLRRLLHECFEVGDAINGVVQWDQTPSELRRAEPSACVTSRTCLHAKAHCRE